MRSIWSGVISFGLVNIPVNLYSASQETAFDFDFLHKSDLSRIRYARMCVQEEKEVPFNEIVRGAKVGNNKYVVLEHKDFERAYPRATRTIEIDDFVNEEAIDPIYFDKPYYLEPDAKSAKPYQLLRKALEKTKKVGVARYVLRNHEYLGMLKPLENVLLLNQLRFDHEIRPTDDLKIPTGQAITAREMDIATSLIEKLSTDFHPQSYRDNYTKKLETLIRDKGKGKVTIKPREEAPQPTQIGDLMAHLKASLERSSAKVHAA